MSNVWHNIQYSNEHLKTQKKKIVLKICYYSWFFEKLRLKLEKKRERERVVIYGGPTRSTSASRSEIMDIEKKIINKYDTIF